MLDLLTVISHHRARLATPIRTVQKIYGDPDMENIPYADSGFRRSAASSRPFLLIDAHSRINGDDKAKPRSTSPVSRANEDQTSKTATTGEPKQASTSEDASSNNFDKNQQRKANVGDASPKSMKADSAVASSPNSPSTAQLENLDSVLPSPKSGTQKTTIMEPVTEQTDAKNESGVQTMKPPVARPAFEDNIVLGVALEGSKRTLPIDEGMVPSPVQSEANELATGRSGNLPSTSPKESKGSVPLVDQRDQDS